MPGSAVPLNGRGKIASVTGQYYTALRYLNRAIALNAQYAPAYQNRATVYTFLKQNEEAAQDLDKVIALAPDNANCMSPAGEPTLKKTAGLRPSGISQRLSNSPPTTSRR